MILADIVSPGDTVVDATCGNGHDSLFLASLIGAEGRLISMDVQDGAVAATSAGLASGSIVPRYQVILTSHERLSEVVDQDGKVSAVVFNLGYLPGGDKSLITRAESTVNGLMQATELIRPSGAVLVTVYAGHDGGRDEAEAVDQFISSLNPKRFSIARHQWLSRSSKSPYVLIIQRKG